jgi:hypothetical protein
MMTFYAFIKRRCNDLWTGIRWLLRGSQLDLPDALDKEKKIPYYAEAYYSHVESIYEELYKRVTSTSSESDDKSSGTDSPKNLTPIKILKNSIDIVAETDLYKEISKPDKTWRQLYQIEKAILRLRYPDEIVLDALRLRLKFKDVVGVEAMFPPSSSPTKTAKETDVSNLRAELNIIVEQIYYTYAMTTAREQTRTHIGIDLLRVSGIWICVLTCLMALGLFFTNRSSQLVDGGDRPIASANGSKKETKSHPASGPTNLILTLYFAGVLGCAGAYISVQARIQSLPYQGDALYRMIIINRGWLGLYLAPFSGTIFALLAYVVFAAQLVKGNLFPEFVGTNNFLSNIFGISTAGFWELRLSNAFDYPKLLIWSFLVGFAERLIPDSLSRLIESRVTSIVGFSSLSQLGNSGGKDKDESLTPLPPGGTN